MKDLKYIIKRILIGVGIGIILMLFRSNVFAATYSNVQVSPNNMSLTRYYCNTNSTNLSWTQATNLGLGNVWKSTNTGLDCAGVPSSFSFGLADSQVSSLNSYNNLSFVMYSFQPLSGELNMSGISGTCKMNSVAPIDIGGNQSINVGGLFAYRITCEYQSFSNGSAFYFPLSSVEAISGNTFYLSNWWNVWKTDNISEAINNQTQQQQEIAEQQQQQQQVCNTINNSYIKTNNKILINNGTEQNNNTNGITDYIKIKSATIKVVKNVNYSTGAFSCFYDTNKTLISCINNQTENNIFINIPNNSEYVRFTIRQDTNIPQFEICTNGNQANADAVNNLNDTLTSDTTPSDSDNVNAYSNFDESTAKNGVITQLITLPVQLFTSISSNLNTSCTRFDLGTLMGTHIYFNCINPANYLGNQLWSVIDILASGFFVWYLAKKFIQVFENLSSMKEGDPVGD